MFSREQKKIAHLNDYRQAETDTLFNLSLDLMCVAGFDGYLKRINSMWEIVLGFTKEELFGQSLINFIHPDDRKTTLAKMRNSSVSTFNFENRFLCKDGSYRWLLWNATPIPDRQVIYATARDISDVKQLEAENQQLRRQNELILNAVSSDFTDNITAEKQYDRFFTLSLDLLCIADLEGYFKRLNPAFQNVLGYTLDELKSKPFIEFIHPEDIDKTLAEVQKLSQGISTIYFENRYRCKDGSYKWLAWTSAPFYEENLIYAVARDISDRKRVEEALQQQAQIIDRVHDSVICTDMSGKVTSWNKGAERLFGYQRSEALGQHISLIYPEEGREFLQQQVIAPVLAKGFHEMEVLMRRRNDSSAERFKIFWAHLSLSLETDIQGKVTGIIGYSMDISDRKAAEIALQESERSLRQQAQQLAEALRELNQTQSQLIQTEKMSSLGQLVAGIAHEINNPVNFIYGNLIHANDYIQDLLDIIDFYQQNSSPNLASRSPIEPSELEFLAEDLPKLLGSMKMGAERIREIVLSLRNFSRLDEASMKPVDIHEGLDNTLLILHYRLKAKSDFSEIEIVKDYGSLPLVECYAGQLNQVFMNIISNAIDVLETQPEPRAISIRTFLGNGKIGSEKDRETHSPNPQYVSICIADNGPGISDRVKARLFDPFFTTKPIGKGTGLGLAISYQIVVEKHSGVLRCESSPGKGTEFWIEIPITPYSV